jgi:hypothetical protein
MVRAVMGQDGTVVDALERGDLAVAAAHIEEKVEATAAKYGFRVLLGAIASLVALVWVVSAYAADIKHSTGDLNTRVIRDSILITENRRGIADNRDMKAQIDSLRFEVRLMSGQLIETTRLLQRALR